MGREKRRQAKDWDGETFALLPHVVLESAAYIALGYTAKSLLVEFALQLRQYNNGTLVCSREFMKRRGWTSWGVVHKAKHELLAAGFIHETFKGQRPNKASLYAVTWRSLPRNDSFDQGAFELFRRGAYNVTAPLKRAGSVAVDRV